MKDKQKVFIHGNPERGDEVIKTLEKLGGKNIYYLSGAKNNAYYYINPTGAIPSFNMRDYLIAHESGTKDYSLYLHQMISFLIRMRKR